MLVYGQKLTLVINYKKHGGSIMERLLEIIEKVPQLREAVRRVIRRLQVELDRKFEGIKTQEF